MNTGFYTNPIFLEHDTGSHPENANRLRAITDKLESEGMLEKLRLQSGRPATIKELKDALGPWCFANILPTYWL